MSQKILVVLIVWLLGGVGLYAQLPDPSFEHYTTDQGLGSDFITSLLKDRRGFMWVGTTNGISRYDGLHFKTFRRQNSRGGLPGNYIVYDGLVEDKKGFLWISTNKGLCRLDPLREEFRNVPIPPQNDDQADNDYTSPLVFDRQGYGWFSSKYHLYRIDPSTLKMKEFSVPEVFDNSFIEPYIDQKNRFWINQQGRLYRFNSSTGQYRLYLAKPKGKADSTVFFSGLSEDVRGMLLATSTQGVWRFDQKEDAFVPYPQLPPLDIRKMTLEVTSVQDTIWWLARGIEGLSSFLPSKNLRTDYRHSLYDAMSHNGGVVLCFYRDPQTGILWIGTDRGLEKIDPYSIKFKRKVLEEAISEGRTKLVTVIRPDQTSSYQDRYWITIREAGLFQWNRSTGEVKPISFGKEAHQKDAFNAVQDQQGRVWVGMSRGIGRYTPETGKTEFIDYFLPVKNRPHEAIVVTFADWAGRIWLGAKDDGLYWYDPAHERILKWPLPAPSGLGFIRRIQQDSRGFLWVLTGAGLYRIDAEKKTTTPVPLFGAPVQPTDRLHSTFSLDSQDQLWVSGIGYVARADTTGRIHDTYTLDNGLLAEHVFSILEDRLGYLWMATDDHLHVLNPRTGKFVYYDRGNGLIEKMIFALVELTTNQRGEVFVGYRGGFNFVQPDALRSNPVPPPLVFTDWKVDNQSRSLAGPLVLRPGENSLTIEFAALNFSQPHENRYAYQLEGFNADWVQTRDNAISFTNLDPGTYTFHVKAANNDGVWNETGASVQILVIPAYWQTNWFRLLILVTIILILVAVFRYREKQRQRLETIRNRIATDLHDDMGSTLSSIRIFSDVVQQQIAGVRPEALPVLQRISSSATNLSESMQDIVWTIQSNHDSLADLVTRMREFGLKMAEARGIDFHMQVGDSFESLKLNLEQRRNIYLIFKESINNAIKYARANRLDVSLSLKGRDLVLLIQDNGQGFDPDTVKPGNGLSNLHKRAQEINGRMIMTSAPGQGTHIEMRMKL